VQWGKAKEAFAVDRKNIGLYLLVGGLLTLVGGFAFNALTSGGGDTPAPQAQASPSTAQTVTADAAQTQPALSTPFPTVAAVATPTPPESRLFAPTFTPVPVTPTATPRPGSTPTPAPSSGGPSGAPSPAAGAPQEGPAAESTPPPLPPIRLAIAEKSLYELHNKERERLDLEPLRLDVTLTDAARYRARDMAAGRYFSHVSPDGQTAFTVLSWLGYRYAEAAENIARNNYPEAQSAAQAMSGFLTTKEYHDALANPRFDSVGVGFAASGDGMKYYVVVFSGR
jgi:uncharacterized protein YkwD